MLKNGGKIIGEFKQEKYIVLVPIKWFNFIEEKMKKVIYRNRKIEVDGGTDGKF
jgi:hypothetical protein